MNHDKQSERDEMAEAHSTAQMMVSRKDESIFGYGPRICLQLATQFLALKAQLDEAKAERDKLFLEAGKHANIPSFEYWKDRAEAAEKRRDEALEEANRLKEFKWKYEELCR